MGFQEYRAYSHEGTGFDRFVAGTPDNWAPFTEDIYNEVYSSLKKNTGAPDDIIDRYMAKRMNNYVFTDPKGQWKAERPVVDPADFNSWVEKQGLNPKDFSNAVQTADSGRQQDFNDLIGQLDKYSQDPKSDPYYGQLTNDAMNAAGRENISRGLHGNGIGLANVESAYSKAVTGLQDQRMQLKGQLIQARDQGQLAAAQFDYNTYMDAYKAKQAQQATGYGIVGGAIGGVAGLIAGGPVGAAAGISSGYALGQGLGGASYPAPSFSYSQSGSSGQRPYSYQRSGGSVGLGY